MTSHWGLEISRGESIYTMKISKCYATLSHSVVFDSLRPMDCSLPGSSVLGASPGKNTGVGCHAILQGIFLTQGSHPVLHIAGRFFTVWATREASNAIGQYCFFPRESQLSKHIGHGSKSKIMSRFMQFFVIIIDGLSYFAFDLSWYIQKDLVLLNTQ